MNINEAISAERDRCLQAVDDETEFPGDMPDEMWDAIAGDRDAMAEALRIAVRLTKDGIRERIMVPNAIELTGAPCQVQPMIPVQPVKPVYPIPSQLPRKQKDRK